MLNIARTELSLSRPGKSLRGLGLGATTSRICMIADVLSWSVQQNIPLQDTLKSLPFCKRADSRLFGLFVGLAWLLSPFFLFVPLPWLKDVAWSYRIRRLINGLDKGEKLSHLLRRHFLRCFPDFYILGIQKAETENRLDVALPILADQLNYPCDVARERKAELFFVLSKIFHSALLLLFLTMIIVPRFQVIFHDLCGSSALLPFEQLSHVAGILAEILAFMVFVILILPGLGRAGEFLLTHMPFLGADLKRFALGDVARSMAAFLRQGDDVITAAEWSLKANPSHWVRKRLAVCIAQMKQGIRWEQAWIAMDIGRPLDKWVIANAAYRDDPVSGFEILSEWLQQETELSTRRIERWLDPVCTLMMALVVGAVAYFVFSTLIGIMYGLM